jgi:hypothetical protein
MTIGELSGIAGCGIEFLEGVVIGLVGSKIFSAGGGVVVIGESGWFGMEVVSRGKIGVAFSDCLFLVKGVGGSFFISLLSST